MGCSDSQPVYDPYAIHPSQRPQPHPSHPQMRPNLQQQQQQQQQQQLQQTPPVTYSVPIAKPMEDPVVFNNWIFFLQFFFNRFIFNLKQKSKAPATYNTKDPDVQLIEKFLEIQTQIDAYDKGGVFDGLNVFEDENDDLRKKKQQAEVNCRVLAEKTKKEKQDYDNITQATVQGFFKDSAARDKAISKEEVWKRRLYLNTNLPSLLFLYVFQGWIYTST